MGATTTASNSYVASGTWENIEETIVSTRNATVNITQVAQEDTVSRNLSSQWVTRWEEIIQRRNLGDPLAQSFQVTSSEYADGIFCTGGELYFKTKDETNIGVEIRELDEGRL